MTCRPVVALALTLAPAALAAQAAASRPTAGGAEGASRAIRVAVDNDLMALRGGGVPPDYDYTHGTRLTVAWDRAPRWLRRRSGGAAAGCRAATGRRAGCVATSLTLAQEIYTPRRDAPSPVAGERPYGGWLHVAGAATHVAPGRTRLLRATLGVTGRPSLAREVQDGVHRLLHNVPQLGWAHQLGTAPGAVVEYAEVRRRERALGSSGIATIRGDWGATLGTVRAGITGGAEAAVGLRGGGPWSPAEPEVERPPRAYVLAGYRQDWVARDVFIEGRGGRRGAERRPFVGQAEVGAGYRWRALALEYRHAARGREYRAQPGAHAVGSVRLTIRR